MTKTKKNQGKKQRKLDYVGTTKAEGKENAEKPLKIDDTPLNVARSFFGIRSDKFDKSQS